MLFSLLVLSALAAEPGEHLPSPPAVAPGGLTHLPAPQLSAAMDARIRGANQEAIQILEAWLSSQNAPWGHRRRSGRFLLGWLYLQDGKTNLASAEFTKVRLGGGPLEALALYYEALCDHRRGRHSVAARECESYRTQWPEGEHADDCLLLIGQARSEAGQHRSAKQAWVDWLDENPGHPRTEQVELDLAISRAHLGSTAALQSLQNFTLYHSYPSIAQQAKQVLDELQAEGRKLPEMDPLQQETRSIMAHVRAGQYEAAWTRFADLLQAHGDDERLQVWLDENAVDIAWKTRNYEAYVQLAQAQYKVNPTGHAAWRIFRALQRSGDHYGAGEWGETAMATHHRHYRWRNAKEQLALTWQLAGEYEKALAIWDQLGRRRGASGRKAKWFGAFSAYRAGQYTDALERLVGVEQGDRDRKEAAQYYRAKVLQFLGRNEEAGALRQKVVEADPFGWYAQLIQSAHKLGLDDGQRTNAQRRGRWSENPSPLPPASPEAAPVGPPVRVQLAHSERELDAVQFNWAALRDGASTKPNPAPKGVILSQSESAGLPDAYTGNPLLNNAADLKELAKFTQDSTEIWPDLEVALHLSQVGLYELAAPYVEQSFREWEDAKRGRGDRQPVLKNFVVSQAEWRAVFHATRDHHDGVRFASLLRRQAEGIENGNRHLRALTHPTAHMNWVQIYAKEYNVDPFFVLGLMRQESLFRRTARSNKGATGLMQVMPYTGSKIAFDLDETFIPDQLADPETNIRYGVWYLSQLLDRFEGGWPLAVAAYNAGPMNVSSWYTRWEGQIELDDFVEQIPFTETRNYVKKVSMHYANYLDIYAENAFLALPVSPGHNRPGIVAY
jgi:hypothetical protein